MFIDREDVCVCVWVLVRFGKQYIVYRVERGEGLVKEGHYEYILTPCGKALF